MPEFKITQIENYLNRYNMKIDTIYGFEDECVFLKIYITNNADYFLLYISSRYTIYTSDDYKLVNVKYIDLSETEEVAEDFANNEENDDYIEEQYDNIINNKNNMIEVIRSYNKQLEIKDYKKLSIFKEVVRFVKRLRYCVSNQNIKIGIVYNNFLCCVKKDNSLDTYEIKNEESKARILYIVIDIDSFFAEDVIDNFDHDAKFVKNAIYSLLKNNKMKNQKKLDMMFNKYKNILAINNTIVDKYEKLKTDCDRLNILLLENIKKQEEIKNVMITKEEYYNNLNTVAADIDKSKLMFQYNKKLKKLKDLEFKIQTTFNASKIKYENAILFLDKIYFENIIMFNSILSNLNALQNLKY